LNVPSYSGGTNPWGTAVNEKIILGDPQSICDGKLEIFGMRGAFHLGRNVAGMSRGGIRVKQGSKIKFTTLSQVAGQVDGEPYLFGPSKMCIEKHKSASMLFNANKDQNSKKFNALIGIIPLIKNSRSFRLTGSKGKPDKHRPNSNAPARPTTQAPIRTIEVVVPPRPKMAPPEKPVKLEMSERDRERMKCILEAINEKRPEEAVLLLKKAYKRFEKEKQKFFKEREQFNQDREAFEREKEEYEKEREKESDQRNVVEMSLKEYD